MPMYVCDREGIFYCNRSLAFGEQVIAESNPNPSYFHELPVEPKPSTKSSTSTSKRSKKKVK